ncbi:ornithine carbamoyltransferase [Candidatus Bathyarchaeota archaeon]|nr:ornithine carbamoyltransferase [Candidatus Bathyarchaeota archaeon]
MQEYTKEELWQILKLAQRMKEKKGALKKEPLAGKILAMIFQKPSTRTRVSFEVGMRQLGGYAIYLNWNELQLGRGETIADTAKVLSRYANGILARVYSHKDIEELAKYADIPVVNGLSDLHHPCQGLSDLFTIWEKKRCLEEVKLAWIGDGNNVCNSLLIGCTKLGVNISVACPKGYEPDKTIINWAKKNAGETGAVVEIVRDPKKAAKNADVIYTDTFVSMGMEAERAKRLKTFIPKYQVTSKLFQYARPEAIFMHCLPCHRGEEVTAEVIDGPRSIVFDQAENRLHVQKAILTLIL